MGLINLGGKLAIVNITPNKGLDKWAVIGDLIKDYTKCNPEEVCQILEAAKELRKQGSDGKTKGKTMQLGLFMPAGLTLLIKQYFPEVFTDKTHFSKFKRKFPGFVTYN